MHDFIVITNLFKLIKIEWPLVCQVSENLKGVCISGKNCQSITAVQSINEE